MINLDKLQTRIRKFATIKYITISTVIMLFFAFLLRSDVSYLDGRFVYGSDVAYKIIDDLGFSGRWTYINVLSLDFGVIVFLAGTQVLIIDCLLNKLKCHSKWVVLYFLPIIRGIFDILENASIAILLLNYPKRFYGIATAAGVFTLFKWITMTITMAVIILLVVMLIWKTFRGKKNMYESYKQK